MSKDDLLITHEELQEWPIEKVEVFRGLLWDELQDRKHTRRTKPYTFITMRELETTLRSVDKYRRKYHKSLAQ